MLLGPRVGAATTRNPKTPTATRRQRRSHNCTITLRRWQWQVLYAVRDRRAASSSIDRAATAANHVHLPSIAETPSSLSPASTCRDASQEGRSGASEWEPLDDVLHVLCPLRRVEEEEVVPLGLRKIRSDQMGSDQIRSARKRWCPSACVWETSRQKAGWQLGA